MLGPESIGHEVLSHLVSYLEAQDDWTSHGVAKVLRDSACDLAANLLDTGVLQHYYCLKFYVHPTDIAFAKSDRFYATVKEAMEVLVEDGCVDVFVSIRALLPEEDQTPGLNNCFFKTETTVTHDELRFRSRGEIAVYEELKRRNVLFFPNPAAVFGTPEAEWGGEAKKREPDFLICYKSKWGILEINGDDFHTGIVQTAKDHDRARLFNHYGVFFIQAYPLERCKRQASEVVDEFLCLLEKYK